MATQHGTMWYDVIAHESIMNTCDSSPQLKSQNNLQLSTFNPQNIQTLSYLYTIFHFCLSFPYSFLKIPLFFIIHGFCVYKFTYSLTFICTPQISTWSAFAVISQTGVEWQKLWVSQRAYSQWKVMLYLLVSALIL